MKVPKGEETDKMVENVLEEIMLPNSPNIKTQIPKYKSSKTSKYEKPRDPHRNT